MKVDAPKIRFYAHSHLQVEVTFFGWNVEELLGAGRFIGLVFATCNLLNREWVFVVIWARIRGCFKSSQGVVFLILICRKDGSKQGGGLFSSCSWTVVIVWLLKYASKYLPVRTGHWIGASETRWLERDWWDCGSPQPFWLCQNSGYPNCHNLRLWHWAR